MELGRHEIHLWLAFPRAITDPVLLDAYEALLCEQERQAHRRFHFPADRHSYLVRRALLRTVLSRYRDDCAPGEWRYVHNRYGRPQLIASQQGRPPLHFNLSRTDGLVACAVALDRDMGVDIERRRPRELMAVAESVFAAQELRDLQSLPDEAAQTERFYRLWTLKEAYIKARGMGLAIPLDQFHFKLDEPGIGTSIYIDEILVDPATDWQLVERRPTEEHFLALAIRKGDDSELRVVQRVAVPLTDELDLS